MEAQRKGPSGAVLITASGVMVAGDHGDNLIDESMADNPHPLAHYWGPNEEVVAEARLDGLPATALRFGQVYDDNPKSAFGRFFLDTAASGKFRYMGSGETTSPLFTSTMLSMPLSKPLSGQPNPWCISSRMTCRQCGPQLLR